MQDAFRTIRVELQKPGRWICVTIMTPGKDDSDCWVFGGAIRGAILTTHEVCGLAVTFSRGVIAPVCGKAVELKIARTMLPKGEPARLWTKHQMAGEYLRG
jgi:hypothetical protein